MDALICKASSGKGGHFIGCQWRHFEASFLSLLLVNFSYFVPTFRLIFTDKSFPIISLLCKNTVATCLNESNQ